MPLKLPVTLFLLFLSLASVAQIGTRLPSEKKVVKDPVTGVELLFLTSTPAGDSKIYPTHPQWTSDGKWLVFRSNRIKGEALAVNETTGDMVQVTDGGYIGMLTLSRKEMRLYFMQKNEESNDLLVKSVDLAKVFADSEKGDDFSRSLYLINRQTREMRLITTGHKPSAQDHPHPTFHPDGDRFQIQSAMLSEDGKSMNICIVKIPENW